MTNFDEISKRIKPLIMNKEDMAKYLPCRCCVYFNGIPIKECIVGTSKCFKGRELWLESEAEE